MRKKGTVILWIPVIISLLLVAGVMTVFSACGIKEDGTWMHCHDAQSAAAVCGTCLLVLFLLCAIFRKTVLRIVLCVVCAAGSILLFLIPGMLMPMCMMATMRCYTVMQPFVRIASVVLLIFAIYGIVREARAHRKP